MDKTHNVFISHHGMDDDYVQKLKARFKEKGCNIRNGSIDSTKYQERRPSKEVIDRLLRRGISWSGTFICLIGEDTHTRPWVNYEIEQAHLQGKQIVGIYAHGCKEKVELPEALKKYGREIIGWNSLDKLGDIMSGKIVPPENPDSSSRKPIYNIVRINC